MAKKASDPEKDMRLRAVQEWILDDFAYSDIIKSAVTKWSISERQAQRYYSEAYAKFKDGQEDNIEKRKAYYLQRKRKLIREIDPKEKKSAYGASVVSNILDSMAKIEGVVVQKHEVTGKDGKELPAGSGTTNIIVNVVPPKDDDD